MLCFNYLQPLNALPTRLLFEDFVVRPDRPALRSRYRVIHTLSSNLPLATVKKDPQGRQDSLVIFRPVQFI